MTKVYFLLVNVHFRPIYDVQDYVDIPDDHSILELQHEIEKFLSQNYSGSFRDLSIWRYTGNEPELPEDDVQAMEQRLKGWFEGKKVRRLGPRIQVQDLDLRGNESLLVQAFVPLLPAPSALAVTALVHLAPSMISYHLFDDKRILAKDRCIELNDNIRTVMHLSEVIQKKHGLHSEICVYRCHQMTFKWKDDEVDLHRQIFGVIKGKEQSGSKQKVKGLAAQEEMISATGLGEKQSIKDLVPILSDEETLLVRLFAVSAANIADLKSSVKKQRANALRSIDETDLVVWRCKSKLSNESTDEYIKNLNFDDDTAATQLIDGQTIWDLHIDDEEILIVQLPENNYATRDTDNHLASLFGGLTLDEFHKKRLEVFGDTTKGSSPSKGAYVTTFLEQQNSNPIFNGHPAHNMAVPVGLYHNAFNIFLARLNHAGASDTPRAHDHIYENLDELLRSFATIYADESSRSAVVMPLMKKLLGQPIDVVIQQNVSRDGIIKTSCGHHSAFLAILEMKNEIGTGDSDPYHQAGLAYRKYWTDTEHKAMAPFCHFPSFLISLAGPWIMISGAIYLDKFMIQPLTDYIWLGGAVRGHSVAPRAVQLFTALRDGISELKSYYEGLQMTAPLSRFPFITSFDKDGLKMEWEYCSQLYSEKLIYEANLKDNTRVIIKFASTYNQEAHELLAKEGYAPRLYHVSRNLYGGLRMIVMERVPGRMLEDGECLNASQYGELKKALELLHKANIVHGDLRPPNIITVEQQRGVDERMGSKTSRKNRKVMLIDFDDCGKAGVGKYPVDLNLSLGWPQGVALESIMQVEHDMEMLKKVEPS